MEDIVQALDATTGDLLWEYRRNLPDNIASVTGTLYRYRNVSIYDNKIFLATNDAYLVALDAQTGEVVWETQRADYRERVAQTAGPVIVKGKVITGSRCNPSSPRPGGCFITAHDFRTGQELWRINTAATPDQPGGDTWAVCRCQPAAMPRRGWSGATIQSSTLSTGERDRQRPCPRNSGVLGRPTCSTRTPRWRSIPTLAR